MSRYASPIFNMLMTSTALVNFRLFTPPFIVLFYAASGLISLYRFMENCKNDCNTDEKLEKSLRLNVNASKIETILNYAAVGTSFLAGEKIMTILSVVAPPAGLSYVLFREHREDLQSHVAGNNQQRLRLA